MSQKNHCDVCDAVCVPPTFQIEGYRSHVEPGNPRATTTVYNLRKSFCSACEAKLMAVLGPLAAYFAPENSGTEDAPRYEARTER